MISSIYAALSALWIVWLSFGVIKVRRAKQVKLGDGNEPELQAAIRAHGNATEYIPISLILLVLLDVNKAPGLLIHVGGCLIVAGRIVHAKALLSDNLQFRVLGMQITLITIVVLAFANLIYFVIGV
ncbi:MAPEG family protein [Crenothrix polyspora]|uniref:Glutathione S-transfersae-related protein n=1 Tax=Crenothrix polyspora TaxID=360316 RepID=A0A1R4H038_9GAMM|nr:MAPEG family protein [Crenothrix polyspora]SJM89591.1 Glutathione S-transfersae-related protein [Crenothrix polyspora]